MPTAPCLGEAGYKFVQLTLIASNIFSINQRNMPCESCNGRDFEDLFTADCLQPSFATLKSSAESGCNFCVLFYAAITSSQRLGSQDIEKLCSGQNIFSVIATDTKIHAAPDPFRDDGVYSKRAMNMSKIELSVGNASSVGMDLRVSADEG